MAFLEFDHALVRACVAGQRDAWQDFVDRFMELTLHVVEHVAERRGARLNDEDKIELCEAIFRALRYNQFQLLREFSFQSRVSTYLVVVARRLAVALIDDAA